MEFQSEKVKETIDNIIKQYLIPGENISLYDSTLLDSIIKNTE